MGGGDYDGHKEHYWFFAPRGKGLKVLTDAGADNIAHHKYKSGDSTVLDNYLSPNVWEPLTNSLPMWLAPNLITTIGFTFNLASYTLGAWYLNNAGSAATNDDDDGGGGVSSYEPVELPWWLFVFNGICVIIYYTLDCMDGKQARRTKSSSPLGQLFDHGMDCLSVLSFLQTIQCMMELPPHLLLVLQNALQFPFWVAQWEEYYTGSLPHSSGNIGVTETNYGLGMWSILTGILFGREMYDKVVYTIPTTTDHHLLANHNFIKWLIGGSTTTTAAAAAAAASDVQVKHIMIVVYVFFTIVLIVFSWKRVYNHIMMTEDGGNVAMKLFASAMSKHLSPLLLTVTSMYGLVDSIMDAKTTNHPNAGGSLSLGLCFCLITIKLIVYSMARMAYADIQYDVLPFVGIVLYTKFFVLVVDDDPSLLFQLLDLYYLARLLYWTRKACDQLCKRLNVQLFRIPYDKKQQ